MEKPTIANIKEVVIAVNDVEKAVAHLKICLAWNLEQNRTCRVIA